MIQGIPNRLVIHSLSQMVELNLITFSYLNILIQIKKSTFYRLITRIFGLSFAMLRSPHLWKKPTMPTLDSIRVQEIYMTSLGIEHRVPKYKLKNGTES